MSLAVSKKTRLARLEAAITAGRQRSLAERLGEARKRAQTTPRRSPDEYLEHCRRGAEAAPRSALAARLLRAAIRLKEHDRDA